MYTELSTWEVMQEIATLTGQTVSNNWSTFVAQAQSLGYSKIISDSGACLGWTKIATTGASYAPQAVTTITTVAETGATTVATGGVITSVAIPVVACGVAAAVGGKIGLELEKAYPEVYDEIYQVLYGDGDTVLAKVTDLFIDGTNYISENVIDKIANFFVGKNAFEYTPSIEYDINMSNTTIPFKFIDGNLNSNTFVYNFLNYSKYESILQNNPSYIPSSSSIIDAFNMMIPTINNYLGTTVNAGSYMFHVQGNEVVVRIRATTITENSDLYISPPLINTDDHFDLEKFQYYNTIYSSTKSAESLVIFRDGIYLTGGDIISWYSNNMIMYNGINVYKTNIYHYWWCSPILGTITDNPSLKGFDLQDNATYPDGTTPLQTLYPEWYQNAIDVPTYDNDGNPTGTQKYYPLNLPQSNPQDSTPPAVQQDAQTGQIPSDNDYSQNQLLDGLQDLIQQLINGGVTPPIDPPTTDTGDTGTLPPTSSASASGLISIYNPTLIEVNQFAGYLWSTDFIDQILKLFNNPMDAIIGMHILYATPQTSGTGNIKCGYLDSGVSSALVSNQYTSVECGSVSLKEYFYDATDYYPYTKIHIYLPFVGIVELNTDDVINATLTLEYKVDVLTGTCLANIYVEKDSSRAVLYTYNGNCAVQLPLSGGNYGSMIASLIGTAVGVVGTVSSGGALAPMAVGGAMSAMRSKANISMSGSLGANAGAMGIRKPYVIISRPYPYSAESYNKYYGFPSNKTLRIGSMSGYLRVKNVHVQGINATNEELNQIESLLKQGVIV